MNKYAAFLFSFLTLSSAAFAANYECKANNNLEGPIALTQKTSLEGTLTFAGRAAGTAVSVAIQEDGGLVVATIEQANKMAQAVGGFTQMELSTGRQQIFSVALSMGGATAGPLPTVAINCTKN